MRDKKPNRKASRRKWLEQMAVPAAAFTLGSTVPGPAAGSTSDRSGRSWQAQQSSSVVDEKSVGH